MECLNDQFPSHHIFACICLISTLELGMDLIGLPSSGHTFDAMIRKVMKLIIPSYGLNTMAD